MVEAPIWERDLPVVILYIYRFSPQIKNLPQNFVILLIVLHHPIFYSARDAKARINDEVLI